MSTKTTEQSWRGQTQCVARVWWVVWSLTCERCQVSVPLVMSQVGLFTSISSGRWRQQKTSEGGKFVPQNRLLLLKICAFSLSVSLSVRNTRRPWSHHQRDQESGQQRQKQTQESGIFLSLLLYHHGLLCTQKSSSVYTICFAVCTQVLSVSWSQTQTREPRPICGYVNHRSGNSSSELFWLILCVATSSSRYVIKVVASWCHHLICMIAHAQVIIMDTVGLNERNDMVREIKTYVEYV